MTMRTKALLVVAGTGGLLVTGLSLRHEAAAATPRLPAVVVAKLPEIGTVYERTYCTGKGPLRFALGIRYLKMGQSGIVRFRAGRFSRHREMQPGDPTAWFPRRRDRAEWLAAAAGGENGVVVGWVRVIGRGAQADTCQSGYDPLRVTVQTYPRSFDYNRNSARYLRRLIG